MLEYAYCSKKLMSYDEAILYCAFCTHDGYTDWRIPTYDDWLIMKNTITDAYYASIWTEIHESKIRFIQSMQRAVILVRDV